MKAFTDLLDKVHGIADDVAKAEAGNKSAGTRARNALKDVKKLAQDVREEILAINKGGK